LGSIGGVLERDRVCEPLELGDDASGGAFGVALGEVVAAGLAVELAGDEHVPAGAGGRVFDDADFVAVPDLRSLAIAASVRAWLSHLLPLRVLPERCLPAERSLPGHWLAQEARWRADGNTLMGRTADARALPERGRGVMEALGERVWLHSIYFAFAAVWEGDPMAAERARRPGQGGSPLFHAGLASTRRAAAIVCSGFRRSPRTNSRNRCE